MLELPGLTLARAELLASGWDDGGLWADVNWLAGRYWAATEPGERMVRWHHLVLAVGNFKRQPGRRLRPARLNDLPAFGWTACESLESPGGEPVHRDRRDTWERLGETLPGAGIATTTTLLSALWPGDHFVFDRRVGAAASGLRIAAGLEPCPSVNVHRAGRSLAPISFDDYVIVRDWMRTVACPLIIVERALYRLSQKVEAVAGRTWGDYSHELLAELEAVDE